MSLNPSLRQDGLTIDRDITLKKFHMSVHKRLPLKFENWEQFSKDIVENETFLANWVKSGRQVYGYTSGFGSSSQNYIQPEQHLALQRNLTRYHQCGVGPFASYSQAKATILARLRNLSRARSGVSLDLIHAFIRLFECEWTPAIPSLGSVGASGDLTPMSYIAAVIQGEGRCINQKLDVISTKELVDKKIITPYQLKGREALAIMNGTSFMTAIAALECIVSEKILEFACKITAANVLIVDGRIEAFLPELHSYKPHDGQKYAAKQILERLLAFGYTPPDLTSIDSSGLQDPYSLRCSPQIIGTAFESLWAAKKAVEVELNSVTDNPVVCHQSEKVIHGGHFFGGHIASVCDNLKSNIAVILNLIDRQVALIMDRRQHRLLPENLVSCQRVPVKSDSQKLDSSLSSQKINHGFKAMQITLSALASEAAKNATPMAIFSRPTESGNQDVVSMGTIAARDLKTNNLLALDGLTIAILTSLQASFLRGTVCYKKVHSIYGFLEGEFNPVHDDRPLDVDITKFRNLCFNEE